MQNIEKLQSLLGESVETDAQKKMYDDIAQILIREDTIVEVTEKAPYYESYYCPVCGDYVEHDSKYCPECGSRMGWQILE